MDISKSQLSCMFLPWDQNLLIHPEPLNALVKIEAEHSMGSGPLRD